MNRDLINSIKRLLTDPLAFTEHAGQITLRHYQAEPFTAIIDSIMNHRGLAFVVMFPRQSGKNELQAQMQTYLLTVLSLTNAEIVQISPTYKPQTINAMRRLERTLTENILARNLWQKESGYIYRAGKARVVFLSGSPTANIVGATASTLLSIDEAQDITPEKYDKDIAPMAASTNATRVFWGTAWTNNTLLEREYRAALAAERADGIRRTWRLTARHVAAEVPAYGAFVDETIRKLGRNHPTVKTQFFSETISGQAGMFPPKRRELMRGSHAYQATPAPGNEYILTIDIAGAGDPEKPTEHDRTAITIAAIDRSTIDDPNIAAPTYRTVHRDEWHNVPLTAQYPRLREIIDAWRPVLIIPDATGIGATIAEQLAAAYPKTRPFVFTPSSKSEIGYRFIAAIETGRYREYTRPDDHEPTRRFWLQVERATREFAPGPARSMRWAVPDNEKDPLTNAPLHDDLLISAALIVTADAEPWHIQAYTEIITPAIDF